MERGTNIAVRLRRIPGLEFGPLGCSRCNPPATHTAHGMAGRSAGVTDACPLSDGPGALDHKSDLLERVLAREGIAAERAVMVGDRSFDVAGAHANGVRAIGVLGGYGSREELEEAEADALALESADLAAAVQGILDF
jgi:hypothetical protein